MLIEKGFFFFASRCSILGFGFLEEHMRNDNCILRSTVQPRFHLFPAKWFYCWVRWFSIRQNMDANSDWIVWIDRSMKIMTWSKVNIIHRSDIEENFLATHQFLRQANVVARIAASTRFVINKTLLALGIRFIETSKQSLVWHFNKCFTLILIIAINGIIAQLTKYSLVSKRRYFHKVT